MILCRFPFCEKYRHFLTILAGSRLRNRSGNDYADENVNERISFICPDLTIVNRSNLSDAFARRVRQVACHTQRIAPTASSSQKRKNKKTIITGARPKAELTPATTSNLPPRNNRGKKRKIPPEASNHEHYFLRRKRNLSRDEFCASKLFESQERFSFSN